MKIRILKLLLICFVITCFWLVQAPDGYTCNDLSGSDKCDVHKPGPPKNRPPENRPPKQKPAPAPDITNKAASSAAAEAKASANSKSAVHAEQNQILTVNDGGVTVEGDEYPDKVTILSPFNTDLSVKFADVNLVPSEKFRIWIGSGWLHKDRLMTDDIEKIKKVFGNIIQFSGKPLKIAGNDGHAYFTAVRPVGFKNIDLWNVQFETPINGYDETAINMAVTYAKYVTNARRFYVHITTEYSAEARANAEKFAAQLSNVFSEAVSNVALSPQVGKTQRRDFPVYKIKVCAYNDGSVVWPEQPMAEVSYE